MNIDVLKSEIENLNQAIARYEENKLALKSLIEDKPAYYELFGNDEQYKKDIASWQDNVNKSLETIKGACKLINMEA